MNTFYFNDRNEQIEEIKPNCTYTEIKTQKSYDEFCAEYDNARADGNSIIDSIE